MARKTPPLTWFRAFEAAARRLSFTGAAAELGMTQSAVSQQVRLLEQRLGTLLFRRLARGIELTDEGRRLVPKVGGAIEALDQATRDFETGMDDPDLTIAASVSFIQWHLAPGLPRFRKRHQMRSIRLINTTWPDEFHRPIADVEIRFGSDALVGKGAVRLKPDESVLVAAPGLVSDVAQLQELPLIQPVGTADTWERWSKITGVDAQPSPGYLVDSHGLAVDLACRGAGVALTSSLIARPCLADGSLTRLDTPAIESLDGYFLAVSDGGNAISAEFARWLLDDVAAPGQGAF